MAQIVERVRAFTADGSGGNPAGVAVYDRLPSDAEMQALAAEIGYSETAFLMPATEGEGETEWRVRYFTPTSEVPFCGHATIASGAVLGRRRGPGVFGLILNEAAITVEAFVGEDGVWGAALQSPSTRFRLMSQEEIASFSSALGLPRAALDGDIPGAWIHGGSDHAVLAVRSREVLAVGDVDMEALASLQARGGLATVLVVHSSSPERFAVRNYCPAIGIPEDPATGAAAAAFAGYLRDTGWAFGGTLHLTQGEDMGSLSHLLAEVNSDAGGSVRVSGAVAWISP